MNFLSMCHVFFRHLIQANANSKNGLLNLLDKPCSTLLEENSAYTLSSVFRNYSSSRCFLRKISSSCSKWADKSVLVIKASLEKVNMDLTCHGLLCKGGSCWQCNAGCATSQFLCKYLQNASCVKLSLLEKLARKPLLAYLGHLMHIFSIWYLQYLISFCQLLWCFSYLVSRLLFRVPQNFCSVETAILVRLK